MSDLHNFNAGRKSWKMYAKNLTSKDGDDLTISPYAGEDLILEVSGNGNILFKEDGITYNLADLSNNLTNYDDASFGNVDISGNLDISNGVINFFASDQQLLGPDTGIVQKVQDLSNSVGDLSNNLLTSNNDASFNNIDITGQITLNGDSGVSGEVLTSQGASAPIWSVPSGGVDAISFYLSTTQNNLTDSTTYQILSFGSYTRGSLSGVSFNTTTNRLDITNAGTYLVSGVAFLKGQSGAIYHTNQSFIQIYNSATPPAIVSSFEGGLAVGSSDPDITGQGAVISSFVYEFNANDSVAFSARALGANFRLLANVSYITFLRIK